MTPDAPRDAPRDACADAAERADAHTADPDPDSGRVVAFFDMDETVIGCNSASRWARFLFRRRELRLRDVVQTSAWLLQYRLAVIDAEAVTRRALSSVRGQPEAQMQALCAEWFEVDIRRFIYDEARAAIDAHRAAGHRVVLLTAATPYIAAPVAAALGMDDHLATRLEVVDGRFTGHPLEPLCYGAGKCHWAEAWAAQHGADLARAHFYTDSYTDLPMLERVGHAVAVNPDPRLRRHARRHRIPIRAWRR